MLLLYSVTTLLAVVSVQSQQPPDERIRNRGRPRARPAFTDRNPVVDLTSQPGYGKGFYRERFAGKSYCSTLENTCCTSRDDDCSVQIGETRCYCDVFCDQGQEYPWNRKAPDCCPDYPQVCKGETAPEPVVLPPRPPVDPRCRGGEFTCVSDKQCIDGRYKCDGTPHCRDGSDEVDCGEFGITLKPDIVHLEDHASHVTHLDFTCEFMSRHNLRIQMTTEPPQRALENLPADRYSYFTTGTEEKSLPIKPDIRAVVCEAYDQYGDKVLYARSKIVNQRDHE